MKVFYTIILSCFFLPIFGQIDMDATNMKRDISFSKSLKNEVKRSKLNFYLSEEWMGGVIFTNDSSAINGCSYKYNIYTDQVELRTLVNPSTVEYLSIGSKKFVYSEYFMEENIKFEGYFELIINGDCRLLLRREVKATQGEEDVRIYGSSGTTRISEILYIKKKNEPAVKIIKSKDFFISMLSDKEPMQSYLKNKFSLFKSEKRIREVINYYNNI